MLYVKVSSRDYSSIYARTPENVTNNRYLPILAILGESTYVQFRLYINVARM